MRSWTNRFSLAAVLVATQGAPEPPQSSSDVVVTAKAETRVDRPTAIDHFVRFCFDPARRSGEPISPEIDPDWLPLSSNDQRTLGVSDPDRRAYALFDDLLDQTFVVKLERRMPSKGLIENRCTLIIEGPQDEQRLRGDLSTLLRGSPTQRHLGHSAGSDPYEGWEEWLWTAIPNRRSQSWRAHGASTRRSGEPGWVVVTNLKFYDSADFVAVDMKSSRDRPMPTSIITLSHTSKNLSLSSPE